MNKLNEVVEVFIRGLISNGGSKTLDQILIGFGNALVHGDVFRSADLSFADCDLKALYDGLDKMRTASKSIIKANS